MSKDKDVTVERSSTSSVPLPLPDMGYGTTIHTTIITDSAGNKYEGTGWTREEADQAAGEAMKEGRKS